MEPQAETNPGTDAPGSVQRQGDRELVATRSLDAAPAAVFDAWARPELFRRWWVPESATGVSLVSCELDVRTGGGYRLEYGAGDGQTMAFHGRYLEVVANQRIVWTNDEEDAGAITTVSFADQDRRTLLTFHERYPTPAAREEGMAGSGAALPIQLDQLGKLLAGMGV